MNEPVPHSLADAPWLTHGPLPRLAWLVIASLVLMIGSFVVLAQFGGSPPRSTYTPAHVENGVLVPGQTK